MNFPTRTPGVPDNTLVTLGDLNVQYYWTGEQWLSVNVGGGGGGDQPTGGDTDKVFFENDKTITSNYTITNNKNAMTAGPVTVASGVTVTVPEGSTWTVV